MKLYSKAIDLPLDGDQYVSKSTKAKIKDMRDNSWWIAKTDVQDHYAKVFNPFAPEDDLTYYCISGDLWEIYEDIKEGVILYEDNRVFEAQWEWSLGVRYHWGRHLTSVLRPLHSILIDDEVSKEMKELDKEEK